MDIELRTHAADPALAFRNIHRWPTEPPESANWRATVVLRSGAFGAELPFYFDDYVLDRFLDALRRMDRTLAGRALLQTPNEEPQIALELSHTGRVRVSGVLLDYEHDLQRLTFSFDTDQTVLGALTSEFEAVKAALSIGAPAA